MYQSTQEARQQEFYLQDSEHNASESYSTRYSNHAL